MESIPIKKIRIITSSEIYFCNLMVNWLIVFCIEFINFVAVEKLEK